MLPTLVWFRQDLRLADNPALHAAARLGPIVPVYVLDETDPWKLGGASRWWLYHALSTLDEDLARLGCRLRLYRGDPGEIIPALAARLQASSVFWNRRYTPHGIARDKLIKENLGKQGIAAQSFKANVLFEPFDIATKDGKPYRVYTPFSKACFAKEASIGLALPAPDAIVDADAATTEAADGDDLSSFNLLPQKPDWAGGLKAAWAVSEKAAQQNLEDFLADAVDRYKGGRDVPGQKSTSRLSPYLAFGMISPRQIWHRVRQHETHAGAGGLPHSEHFLKEVLWREFSYHLLYHFPDLPEKPLQPAFADFPWAENTNALRAWQRGQTGFPIVDAGMRELWETGWMHNRVRMIVASFLVKNLLIPWQMGEAWFWDTLVDADLANNAASWQWVSGCGADAAPYFRIFNPVLQGERFDVDGVYVRRFVPEIAALPNVCLHQPWNAPAEVLLKAGVTLGLTYPAPMVDHGAARDRALAAYATIKQGEA